MNFEYLYGSENQNNWRNGQDDEDSACSKNSKHGNMFLGLGLLSDVGSISDTLRLLLTVCSIHIGDVHVL